MPCRADKLLINKGGGLPEGAWLLLESASYFGHRMRPVIKNIETRLEVQSHEASVGWQSQPGIDLFTAHDPICRFHQLDHEDACTNGMRRSRGHNITLARLNGDLVEASQHFLDALI